MEQDQQLPTDNGKIPKSTSPFGEDFDPSAKGSPSSDLTIAADGLSMYTNGDVFKVAWFAAQKIASSGIVPKDYTNNPGACLIAIELAQRWRLTPFLVMQNTPIIHGKPGVEGKFAIGLLDLNRPGIRKRWVKTGNIKDTSAQSNFSMRLEVDYPGGRTEVGTEVTMKMVHELGWWSKTGSFWPKMTEQMFVYRSAAFFLRQHEPGLLLGMSFADELVDMGEAKVVSSGVAASSLNDDLKALAAPVEPVVVLPREEKIEVVDTTTGEVKEQESLFKEQPKVKANSAYKAGL